MGGVKNSYGAFFVLPEINEYVLICKCTQNMSCPTFFYPSLESGPP